MSDFERRCKKSTAEALPSRQRSKVQYKYVAVGQREFVLLEAALRSKGNRIAVGDDTGGLAQQESGDGKGIARHGIRPVHGADALCVKTEKVVSEDVAVLTF